MPGARPRPPVPDVREREFLIRRIDGEWFSLRRDDYGRALAPISVPSVPVEGYGDHRIRVLDVEVSFTYEDPGIQVSFHGGPIADSVAMKLVEEFLAQLELVTGERGEIVALD